MERPDRAAASIRPLRVMLVAHEIHDRGGMERACAELIRHLHDRVQFVLVAADVAPDVVPLVDRWFRLPVPRRPFPLKFLSFFLMAPVVCRRIRPDVVHTVGALVPGRADVVAVHFCHVGARRVYGSLLPKDGSWARRINTAVSRVLALQAERWCYRSSRTRRFAPVSAGVSAELEGAYPGIRATVVPNGVDTDRFRPDLQSRSRTREAEQVGNGEIVALFVGGDWHRKGLAVALEALAILQSLDVPVRLWVVGSGDERYFESMARSHECSHLVTFFGNRSSPEDLFQAADLFLMPTRYETFSIASHEAAACGLPIIATAVSGIAELIGENEAGLLVSGTSWAVADAVRLLAGRPDLRESMGREGRRRARAFTWAAAAESLFEVYQDLGPTN